jgi:hypothetical protein
MLGNKKPKKWGQVLKQCDARCVAGDAYTTSPPHGRHNVLEWQQVPGLQ